MFYHGTSNALEIEETILPPSITGVKREDWRNKYNDKVFFTNSRCSAEKFAKKASKKYGGTPIVFSVQPKGEFIRTTDGEYIADYAKIIGEISV